jgi:hypothetical protein
MRSRGVRDPSLGHGSRQPVELRDIREILSGRELVIEAHLVGKIPHAGFHFQGLAHGIKAEHSCPAIGGLGQPQQHQDRRGLAGAVGSQNPEDLPGANLKI